MSQNFQAKDRLPRRASAQERDELRSALESAQAEVSKLRMADGAIRATIAGTGLTEDEGSTLGMVASICALTRALKAERDDLAETVLADRAVFRRLRASIAPMAAQIISPRDNTLTRQLEAIDSRLVVAELLCLEVDGDGSHAPKGDQ